MSVKFDLYESPSAREEGKKVTYHPRIIRDDVINTQNLCDQITAKCTLTRADVSAVISSICDEMADAFLKGRAVHIKGIGYFNLVLQGKTEIDSKHVSSSDICVKSIKFTPDKEMLGKLETIKFERNTVMSNHSDKMSDEVILEKLSKYFKKKEILTRKDFEHITGFNQTKSIRYIRRLLESKVIKNLGTKYQPVYVKGNLKK